MAKNDDKFFPQSDPPPSYPEAGNSSEDKGGVKGVPSEWVETRTKGQSDQKDALEKLSRELEKEKQTANIGPQTPPVNQQVEQSNNSSVSQRTGGVQNPNLQTAAQTGQEQSMPSPQSATKPIPAKKGPPKILLFAIGGLVILIIIALIVFILKPGQQPLVGTPGEITWWGYQYSKDVMQPLIDEYESKNPTVKITYIQQSQQDYRERLTNALAAGTGPDIFEIHNSWPAMFMNDLAPMPASVMSKDEFENSFYPVIASDLVRTKGVIAMPLEYDALALFINEDIFTSAFQRPPTTWDDLRSLVSTDSQGSLTITDKDGRIAQSGVALGVTENTDYWPEVISLMLFQNEVDPARPISKEAADVFGFFSFFKSNRVWDEDLPPSTIYFTQGKLAMFFAPSRSASEIAESNPSLQFRTERLPQLPKNDPGEPDFSYATYWVQGVWERSRNKELAWDFLKFMSSESVLQKLNQNIKEATEFNRAYPRPHMNEIFREDEILGSVVLMAQNAKSWYLADKTNDGENGINTRLANVFSEILSSWRPSTGPDSRVLSSNAPEIRKILSQFVINQ